MSGWTGIERVCAGEVDVAGADGAGGAAQRRTVRRVARSRNLISLNHITKSISGRERDPIPRLVRLPTNWIRELESTARGERLARRFLSPCAGSTARHDKDCNSNR